MSILFSYDNTTSWDDGHFDQFFASTYANPFPSTKRVAGTPVWHDGTPYGLVDFHDSYSSSGCYVYYYFDVGNDNAGAIVNLKTGEVLLQIEDDDYVLAPNTPGLVYYSGCFYFFRRESSYVKLMKYDISAESLSALDSYSYSYHVTPAVVLDDGYLYFSYEEVKWDVRSGTAGYDTWLTCKKIDLSTETVTTIDSKTSVDPGPGSTSSDGYKWNCLGPCVACTDSNYYYTTVRGWQYDRWRYVKKDGTANGWAEGSYRANQSADGMSTYLGSDLGFAFRNDYYGEYVFFMSGGSVSSKVATDTGIPARLGGGYVLNSSDPYYVLLFAENSTNCYLVEVDVGNETNTLKETYTGIGGASCSTFRGGSQLIKAGDIEGSVGPLYTYGYNRSNGFFFPYGEIL